MLLFLFGMEKENLSEEDKAKKKPIYQGRDALAPYPLHVGSPKIKAVDKRLVKGTALETMTQQADQQISMLRKQAELLMEQVREIQERVNLSYEIYKADLNFEPVIGTIYHVYVQGERTILSLVSPSEWGKLPFDSYNCSVKLLADKSWEIQK